MQFAEVLFVVNYFAPQVPLVKIPSVEPTNPTQRGSWNPQALREAVLALPGIGATGNPNGNCRNGMVIFGTSKPLFFVNIFEKRKASIYIEIILDIRSLNIWEIKWYRWQLFRSTIYINVYWHLVARLGSRVKFLCIDASQWSCRISPLPRTLFWDHSWMVCFGRPVMLATRCWCKFIPCFCGGT